MGKTFRDKKRYFEEYEDKPKKLKKPKTKERKKTEQQIIEEMVEHGNLYI